MVASAPILSIACDAGDGGVRGGHLHFYVRADYTNRQAQLADKRADLDLQISLLSEHEITRLITLLTAIGEKLGVEEARNPSLAPLKNDVAPEQVLEKLDSAK